MATWESSCPVQGQCSECGLEFAWREVLVDRERTNPRHIEHCSRRAIPIAAIRTLLWCILPWVFWKRVKLQHEPRVGRMVLWLGAILLGAHFIASTAVAVAMWRLDVRYWNQLGVPGPPRPMLVKDRADLQQAGAQEVAKLELWFGVTKAEMLEKFDAVIETTPASWVQPGFGFRYLLRAPLFPIAVLRNHDHLMEWIREGSGITRYGQRGASISLVPTWRHPALIVGVAASLGFPGLILLLPATRRKLRIRKAHIARAMLLGQAWLLIPAILRFVEAVGVVIVELLEQSTPPNLPLPDSPLALSWHVDWAMWSWIILIWISLWWLSAIWRAYRFPAPLFHSVVLTLATWLLAAAALMSVVSPPRLGALINPGDWLQPRSGIGSQPQRLLEGEIQFMDW